MLQQFKMCSNKRETLLVDNLFIIKNLIDITRARNKRYLAVSLIINKFTRKNAEEKNCNGNTIHIF